MIAAPLDMTTDLDKESWITKPYRALVAGTVLVLLIFMAGAIPLALLQKEQGDRSDGIEHAAVAIVCGTSAFIDKQTAPLSTPTQDPVSRAASNARALAARNDYRAFAPAKYLKHCKLAP